MKETLGIDEDLLGQVYRISGERRGERPTHSHDELELNLVMEGRAEYLVDETKVILDAGALLWLFPSQEHVLSYSSKDFEMWVYVFKPGLVERACRTQFYTALRSSRPVGNTCVRLRPQDYRRLVNLCEEAAEAREADVDVFNAALRYLMLKAWRMTAEADASAPVSHRLHPVVFKAALLLHRAPETKSLSALATKVGMSLEHLSRVFKRQMGQTLSQYRNEQRLRRVHELMQEGRLNLLQATVEAGFGSYSQFYRVQKAKSGVAPSSVLGR